MSNPNRPAYHRSAIINWPPALQQPSQWIANMAGWHMRNTPEGYSICLNETYQNRAVSVLCIRHRLPDLGRYQFQLDFRSWDQAQFPMELLDSARSRLNSEALVDRLAGLRLGFLVFPREQLGGFVNECIAALPELHGGIGYIVETDYRLFHRQISVARLLIRAVHDPAIITTMMVDPTQLEAGMGLHSSDLLGGMNILLPALAADYPQLVGIVANRASGSLVLLFPASILDEKAGEPARLAELLRPSYFTVEAPTPGPRQSLTLEDADRVFNWWIGKWNRVLGQLVDPATAIDRNGVLDPLLMLGRFVSLERFLACLQELLIQTGRDNFVRMTMLFDGIDLLEGIGGGLGQFGEMTLPSNAEQHLEELRSELAGEPAISALLLPRCEKAVQALADLRSGFRGRAATSSSNDEIDEKVRDVLRSLRNAGHGLGRGAEAREAVLALMTHHLRFSPHLPDLLWLQLLRLLCTGEWRQYERPSGRTSQR